MSTMPAFDIDPTEVMYKSEYPEPEVDATSPQAERSNKKKRKAWGQPVPHINPILPPRKRAKTAEEKEQRKNERILRNRRAADKSRQRQKLAVADLEATKEQMEQENAQLRQVLEKYRARFGDIDGFCFDGPSPASSAPTLVKSEPQSDHYSVATPMSSYSEYSPNEYYVTPALSSAHPAMLTSNDSPSLAPTLFPSEGHQAPETGLRFLESSDNFGASNSGMTQYSAAVLCDPQCQPEMLVTRFPILNRIPMSSPFLQYLNLLMIFQAFSTTILSPLFQTFQVLAQASPTTSTLQNFFQVLDKHYLMIHSLISRPSPTATSSQPIFRVKLLSRLLATTPRMARLLLAATDRELQRLVQETDLAQDGEARTMWASLLTVKWTILRLEKEHRRYRRGIVNDRKDDEALDGVDYRAVGQNYRRWLEPKLDGQPDANMYDYKACPREVEVQ